MSDYKYDYLIVGSGLFGATFAHLAHKQGKRCLVIDKRPHLGGNVYCENIEGINVHKYGAHIFHTSNKRVWDFVNSIVEFNRYTNSPVANYKGKLYNLPFNMNTFYQMWGVTTPEEAQAKIDEQKAEARKSLSPASPTPTLPSREGESPTPTFPRREGESPTPTLPSREGESPTPTLPSREGESPTPTLPSREGEEAPPREGFGEASNLEEQALLLVGKDIYERLIKGYTEKQWGRKCTELPAFIIKRLPVRLVFDNNYFNDKYQGIPVGGYNKLIEGLLNPTSPTPTLPRGEGESSATTLSGSSLSLPTGEGRGGAIDVLTGIDVPLNKATRCLNKEKGGYRETADPMNYGLLKENAKEMRKNPTEAESAFWSLVSGNNLGAKFRRQHIIGNYIVDFVCLEKKLVVELDGGYHDDPEQQIADNIRSKELKEYGFTILRLRNEEVLSDTEALKEKLNLAMWLAERAPIAPPRPSPEGREKAPLREGFGEAESPSTGGFGEAESPSTGGFGEAESPSTGGVGEAPGWRSLVYTGPIDEYFGYCFGKLDWRTVSFKTRVEDTPNYQGNAVVNYTSHDEPYTRVIEHKHFEMFGQEVYDCPKTVVSEEYSTEYKDGMEPYYPVNDDRNNALAAKYRQLAHEQGIVFADEAPPQPSQNALPQPSPEGREKAPLREGFGEAEAPLREGFGEAEALFGGRLAEYKYYDMAPVIEKVLQRFE